MPATLLAVLALSTTFCCCLPSLASPQPCTFRATPLRGCLPELLPANAAPWWQLPLATTAASLPAAKQLPPELLNERRNVWEVNYDTATSNHNLHNQNQTWWQADMFMLSYISKDIKPLCLTNTQFVILRNEPRSVQWLDMLYNRNQLQNVWEVRSYRNKQS
jgi:hypothetical protein